MTEAKTRSTGLPAATDQVRQPAWVAIPGVLAPTSLIAGWLLAVALQPAPAKAVWATISDLAARYASRPEVMTVALIVTGVSLVAVAAGLVAARAAGRAALGVSGAGVLGVSATPLPDGYPAHSVFALVALSALSLWPCLGARDHAARRLGRGSATTATGVGLALLGVLYLMPSLLGGFGMVEKLLAGLELIWLALVVMECAWRPAAADS